MELENTVKVTEFNFVFEAYFKSIDAYKLPISTRVFGGGRISIKALLEIMIRPTCWGNPSNSGEFLCFAGGLRGAVRGGVVGFALSGLYTLYNNWDHLKGSTPTRY